MHPCQVAPASSGNTTVAGSGAATPRGTARPAATAATAETKTPAAGAGTTGGNGNGGKSARGEIELLSQPPRPLSGLKQLRPLMHQSSAERLAHAAQAVSEDRKAAAAAAAARFAPFRA